ncbi:MAG: peptide-methionine (S)-S-oxide reductase MsrA [Rhizobiaceae bacterium]
MKAFSSAFLAAAFISITPPAIAVEKEAIFAGGCFWCIEKDFEHVAGVKEVVSGYTGGSLKKPTYRNHTGHREAVKITYDDSKVSYEELLDTFWRTVDPTDGGGQFCDRGHAYSTAVYYMNDTEHQLAKATKDKAAKDLKTPIATAIEKASFWTDSEKYHQNYYKKNPIRYGYYRRSCGRDARVKSLWGNKAYPRVNH